MIFHLESYYLRSSLRKLLKGREDWRSRVSAMAKSMMSFLKRLLWSNPDNMAFCSGRGRDWKAVKKISALAWMDVIEFSLTQQV